MKDIKLGKHDGKYSLTSDHVVNSSRRFLVILSILMSSMLVHGYKAADLLSSTIISIPKDAREDINRRRQLQRNKRCVILFASSLILYLAKNAAMYCALAISNLHSKQINSTTVCTGILMEQWESHTSRSFHVCNGVKQGAVISPILFAVYYDELIAKLASSGYGCRISQNCVGALSYADDITLLSPFATRSAIHGEYM